MASVKQVVDRTLEALRARDVDAFVQLYSSDAEITGPGGRVMCGQEGARQFFNARLQNLSHLDMTIESERLEGSTLILRGTAAPAGRRGGRRQRFLPPGGQAIPFEEVFHVEGDLIRGHRLRLGERYFGTARPWEIGRPQPAFVALARSGRITGRVLDAGCGTGQNALFFAELGLDVIGIDASERAIEKARAGAEQRGLPARFLLADVTELTFPEGSFDTAVDSGFLHALPEEDCARFVTGVHAVLRPGGRYYLMCLNEHASMPGPGPRRLTQDEIRKTFADGWLVESIDESRFEVNPDSGVSSEDAAAWLASIRRA